MAIPAQGLTFTWSYNGELGSWYTFPHFSATFQEIQDLEVVSAVDLSPSRGGGLARTGRLKLRGFSIAGLPQTRIGWWGVLEITAPQVPLTLWKGYARYETSTVVASRNDAVLFAFEFRLGSAQYGSGE
jgi:hypothetical protein